MVMTGGTSESWAITFVFFRLMVSPNSLQAWAHRSTSLCRSVTEWDTRATSSAKEDTPDLRFGTKSGNVEELAICSCEEVNPFIAVAERILEKQWEEDSEQCRSQHTSLFKFAADRECFWCCTFEAYYVVCVFMEGSDDVKQSWRISVLRVWADNWRTWAAHTSGHSSRLNWWDPKEKQKPIRLASAQQQELPEGKPAACGTPLRIFCQGLLP